MTIRPVLTAFSAGELSPKLSGRVDLPVYFKGAKEITNFRVEALGGVTKRPGTTFYAKTQDNFATRIIPWVVADDKVFLLAISASDTASECKINIYSGIAVGTGASLPLASKRSTCGSPSPATAATARGGTLHPSPTTRRWCGRQRGGMGGAAPAPSPSIAPTSSPLQPQQLHWHSLSPAMLPSASGSALQVGGQPACSSLPLWPCCCALACPCPSPPQTPPPPPPPPYSAC